ncbi:glycosyltransferase [Mammaliicoccus sciuri]|uniref:glycosyltransferase n=1 Tax=Mammaliicoccus sciuri TaxID=1296 RepID=UPI0018C98FC5|nr:glycosyltransferase [Mammaliicoccus sciuri]MBG9209637.1 glycosyltransferase [Mammaliicoccus sciuri]MCI8457326.1 glycosyltransferase family 4 protein [Mammaliicoccus sciuri]MDT0745288.1 glycosyltransferase [Mammaliicoccus sciuri]MDT0751485.1 glycosyltransferase [Mammaliicoccus sciuri]WQL32411.1 glycosyltransferase [Mammaliicoccus sciuri]
MKKVTMFVWNHFTNDARVNRECTTLADNGYDVNLIAINDPKNTAISAYEEISNTFKVHRVKRYPWLLQAYQDHGKKFLLVVAGVQIVIIPSLFYISFTLMAAYLLSLVVAAGMIKLKKIRRWFINGAIITRMIVKGYIQNADIYHANDLNTLPQAIVCSKLRLKPKPLIYDSHEVQSDRTGYNPKTIKRIESFMLKFVDQMIVENHTRAKYNEDIYGFYPKTLYNYSEKYNIEEKPQINLHKRISINEDEKILLYQGGLQQGRGLELLIEAMDEIEEGHLLFIGGGKLTQTLKEQAEASKQADRIHFLDKVPFQELPSYTREAYLGFQVLQNVCFNHYSASSNKLFEYMMAHVPVISCDFPEIKKVVEETNTGLVVDSHKASEIANAVNQLVKDTSLRNQLSENTKQAKEIYNWNNEKSKLLEVYNQFVPIECQLTQVHTK